MPRHGGTNSQLPGHHAVPARGPYRTKAPSTARRHHRDVPPLDSHAAEAGGLTGCKPGERAYQPQALHHLADAAQQVHKQAATGSLEGLQRLGGDHTDGTHAARRPAGVPRKALSTAVAARQLRDQWGPLLTGMSCARPWDAIRRNRLRNSGAGSRIAMKSIKAIARRTCSLTFSPGRRPILKL